MDLFDKTKGLKLIKTLKEQDLYPFFRVIHSSSGRRVSEENHELIMMGSNNYLGLTHDKRVIEEAKKAIDMWGTGCTGSRFLNGNLKLHKELEQDLSKFLGFESTIVFASGFLANQGAIAALTSKDDYILSDEDNHASIIEGCRSSEAKVIIYKHLDMKDLESKLKSIPKDSAKLIVSDGMFSMSGKIINYDEIHNIALKYNAKTYIDDAHALGTIGENGRGTIDLSKNKPDILIGTFSKSLASQGGFVCSRRPVIEWIEQHARSYMFSASLSPASAASAKKALEILTNNNEIVQKLQKNAEYLNQGLLKLGLNTMDSKASIIPVFVGDDKKALKLCSALSKEGIFTTAVVYPAVTKGSAIIRLSVMSTHEKEDLDITIKAFEKYSNFIKETNDHQDVALHSLLKS